MPLAFEVDAIDALEEPIKALYTKADNGKFRLGIEGLPAPEDTAGLKKKVSELLEEKKTADAKAKKAAEEARAAADDAARKAGDVTALEKSWSEKHTAAMTEKDAENQRLNSSLNKVLVDGVAMSLSADLAVQGSANVLLPHIRNRLKVDWVDGEPVTRVLGLDGKPSALTLDELKAEFAANKAFAPLIAATKATGGGAAGAGRGGAAAEKSMKRADFDALAPHERSKFVRGGGQITD